MHNYYSTGLGTCCANNSVYVPLVKMITFLENR